MWIETGLIGSAVAGVVAWLIICWLTDGFGELWTVLVGLGTFVLGTSITLWLNLTPLEFGLLAAAIGGAFVWLSAAAATNGFEKPWAAYVALAVFASGAALTVGMTGGWAWVLVGAETLIPIVLVVALLGFLLSHQADGQFSESPYPQTPYPIARATPQGATGDAEVGGGTDDLEDIDSEDLPPGLDDLDGDGPPVPLPPSGSSWWRPRSFIHCTHCGHLSDTEDLRGKLRCLGCGGSL